MRPSPLVLSLILLACSSAPPPAPEHAAPPAFVERDPSSYAEPDRVRIEHLSLELGVDFAARTLSGTALLTLAWHDATARELVLDTRDLSITQITDEAGDSLPFTLAPRDPVFGQKLTIMASRHPAQVRITYRTSQAATGLLWLEPGMTAGKTQPFLFSQSQSIHARSWIPVQDTPSVRFRYDATIHTPPELTALMSADNQPDAPRTGVFSFHMPEPIPSYLLALAVGDLVFKPISERSGVWAEPSVVESAQREFEDTERMIQTAEALYGAYRWQRYDILVLPPSFPYGGMENPRITFATPTVIVGDKSLVSLIAHELAHSWSGNLVTNASWKDGWLNEGFTSYVENRLVEALYGAEAAAMENVISQHDLLKELPEIPEADQRLALPPFGTRDPDDVLTDIEYVKGQWFLMFLEARHGRAVFDPFLRKWFDDHAFQSTDSAEFERFLRVELLDKVPGKVSADEVKAFMHGPGIPAFATRATSSKLSAIDARRAAFLDGSVSASGLEHTDWSTQERVYFLEGLPHPLALDKLAELDAALSLTGTPNGEVAMRWYPLCEASGYAPARAAMAEFLGRVGRRKLIGPIYEALARTDEGKAFARRVFEAAKEGYHPVARQSIAEMLAPEGGR